MMLSGHHTYPGQVQISEIEKYLKQLNTVNHSLLKLNIFDKQIPSADCPTS